MNILNKIESLLPKEKEHIVFECNGAYNGRGCFEDFCDVKTCNSKSVAEMRAYNQALSDIKQTLPQILDLIREEIYKNIDELGDQNQITQAILGAMEYRGFYDCGKYLDKDIWDKIKPFIKINLLK